VIFIKKNISHNNPEIHKNEIFFTDEEIEIFGGLKNCKCKNSAICIFDDKKYILLSADSDGCWFKEY